MNLGGKLDIIMGQAPDERSENRTYTSLSDGWFVIRVFECECDSRSRNRLRFIPCVPSLPGNDPATPHNWYRIG